MTSTKNLVAATIATALIVAISAFSLTGSELPREAGLTLVIFVLAVWAWIFTPLADVYVALAAACSLVVFSVIDSEDLAESLGNETIWLLFAAVVMAEGISRSGLSSRIVATLITRARTFTGLFWMITLALMCTAFLVPSTSGRAALALPLLASLHEALGRRERLTRALSLLIPSVILISAVSSYIGAGAHLITDQILDANDLETIGFLRWMILGSGLGLVASALTCALVMGIFLDREERKESLQLTAADIDAPTGEFSAAEQRVLTIVIAAVVGWCTESIHGVEPAIIAVLGALAITAPGVAGLTLTDGLKKAPWPLLVFMAATLALGKALVESGAAEWLGEALFAPLQGWGDIAQWGFLLVLIAVSTYAHLMIQSRSARSAVLIPLVLTAATSLGVNPVAAAFASTAAAGFCHTLTSSAKPVALFSQVEDLPGYSAADLLKLSLWLGPAHGVLVAIFTVSVWPLLGMPFFASA
ncbi:SLC13 family permease [Rothia sp. LK2588]|uniref:SLC13 family permease n=1 Tax=Rothia sp. LK2588 TaxID=3114369 RepID=UPI0034CFBDB4